VTNWRRVPGLTLRPIALCLGSLAGAAMAASAAAESTGSSGPPAVGLASDSVAVQELLRNARLWQQLGRGDNERLVWNKLLALDAAQPQALLGLGELALREGRPDEAQRILERLQATRAPEAAELQALVRTYTRDGAKLAQLRLLRRGGNTARALALARELFPTGRAPGLLAQEFAPLFAGSRAAAAATAAAPAARGTAGLAGPVRRQQPGSARAGASASPRAEAPMDAPTGAPTGAAAPTATRPAAPSAEERYWPLLREAQALRDAGRWPEAAERLAAAQALVPGETEGLLLRAEVLAQDGRAEAAEATYRQLLERPAARPRAAPRLLALLQGQGRTDDALAEAARLGAPEGLDSGALRAAADARVAAGQPGSALQLLQAASALRPLDPWLRHDLARLYARLGQPAQGQAVMAEGLAAAPGDADMRLAAGLINAAIDGEARARQAALAALAARQQPREEVALFPFYRRAAEGRSSLRGVELPLVVTRPGSEPGVRDAPDGERWLHVDAVVLDAGTLPATFDEASQFGQVQATGQPLAAPLAQRARGLSLGAGWTGDDRRWDAGVVGAGFEVPNLVGGWRQNIKLGAQDAALELSRRVLTGSLLAYAGTRDPVSGRRWGGVTLNAASLRVAADLGAWSTSASLRAGLLQGHNVASNSTVQLRLAGDRDWLDTPALKLNAGLTLSLWSYRRNLGFYTFGQGGYYSPQRYTSLGLPVLVQGRVGAWSYRARAAVSRSWTYEADTPYHPTDAALQARAGALLHRGEGRGGGSASSVRIDVERRLSPHWAAGGAFIADRSAFYAPTQWLFYLRHSGQPQRGELPLPRPVQPYSQF